MIYLFGVALLVGLIVGPSLWVKAVIRRYSAPADRYPGTGGELAEHLLEALKIDDVGVEQTELGDHYDPTEKVVRLGPDHYNGRSLAAITIAAHEVGHAIQHATGYLPLQLRTKLVRLTGPLQRLGAGVLMLSPVIGAVTRAPSLSLVMIFGGLLSLGAAAMVHMLTLPTEFDASFSRAMPLLVEGGFLKDGDEPHARKLLRAAALTYVSASLMSLLNVGRWWAILRR
ncbi:MAG: zinc metallopeptidase [Gammaproteobacteria bacterium]